MGINIPAIAKKTFDSLKDNKVFMSIANNMVRKLQRADSPIDRAKILHDQIDHFNRELFKNPVVQKHVSCKNGCSACCHTQVSVTEDEAHLLATKADKLSKRAWDRLYIQAKAVNDNEKFYQIPYELRKCVFLDDNNSCSIYEDRPAVCRNNFAVAGSEQCETKDGTVKPTRLLNTPHSDMAIYGAYELSPKNGVLPSMLLEVLNKMKANRIQTLKNIRPFKEKFKEIFF